MFRNLLIAALLSGMFSAPALAASAAISAAEAVGSNKEEFPGFNPLEVKLAENERLTYQIKWGVVDAGQAVLTVKRRERYGPDGAEVWNVQCATRSNAFVSMFYEVRDDIKTLIDVKEGFTRHFDMKKNEGSFHGSEQILFDYDRNVANYTRTEKGTFSDKVRNRKVPLPGRVHDPMSCLYYIRGLDLKPGSEHKLTVNTDRKNWVLTLKVLKTEEMFQKDLGTMRVLVVEPEAQFQGIFVRKGKMTVWLEERTRIPLMMKVEVPIGSVTATLVKAEGTALTEKSGKQK